MCLIVENPPQIRIKYRKINHSLPINPEVATHNSLAYFFFYMVFFLIIELISKFLYYFPTHPAANTYLTLYLGKFLCY